MDYLQGMMLFLLLMVVSGCNFAPVLEGDYNRNMDEIQSALVDSKKKIADNAEMINTVVVVEKDVAQVMSKMHAEKVSEWSQEPVEFSEATTGSQMLNLGLGLLGLAGFGGAATKICSLSNLVKQVAVLPPDEGKDLAIKKGVRV